MSSEVHEGQILAGKFRIERVLGQGGMGVVVAATHLQLEERVALKFLLPQALTNPEAVERFAREARAAVKIKSEHVARVSDVGTLESGSPYMVMEYLHGEDLAAWVRRAGAMAVPDAIEFLLQASEALAEAHALGIVHRDLKPANLFVTRRADGSACIKVLDFGISKVTTPGGAADLGMTKTTAIMGSPLYMTPEQMSSTRNVDRRTDIWALGVILYESLSGRVPFEAETMPQLCGMILQDSPQPLRSFRPDVPEALERVILHCLEKNREHRFSNVAELAFALAPFGGPAAQRSAERIARVLAVAGMHALPSPTGPAGSLRSAAGTRTASAHGGEPKRSRRTSLVILAGALLVLGAGALLLARRPALESAAEPAFARRPSAASPSAALAISPVPSAVEVAPLASASSSAVQSAPARTPAPMSAIKSQKPRPLSSKPKASTAPAAPVEIDPLDGRR